MRVAARRRDVNIVGHGSRHMVIATHTTAGSIVVGASGRSPDGVDLRVVETTCLSISPGWAASGFVSAPDSAAFVVAKPGTYVGSAGSLARSTGDDQ
jgi:hypothetical protein